jgi:hypothetical protein
MRNCRPKSLLICDSNDKETANILNSPPNHAIHSEKEDSAAFGREKVAKGIEKAIEHTGEGPPWFIYPQIRTTSHSKTRVGLFDRIFELFRLEWHVVVYVMV